MQEHCGAIALWTFVGSMTFGVVVVVSVLHFAAKVTSCLVEGLGMSLGVVKAKRMREPCVLALLPSRRRPRS